MNKLYFTIGLPRSGKSTFCHKWQSEKPMRVVVNSDNIRLALHGKRYIALAETMVFAIKHIMIRSLLAQGYDVLVDGTHTSKISIQRLLEIRNDAIPIIFDTTIDTCIQRAIETNQDDLVDAIKRTGKQMDNLMKIGIDNVIKEIKKEIDERGLFSNKEAV